MSKPGREFGQFRDPFGLIRRMLGSGDRDARWALMHAAAFQLARPFDALLGLKEGRGASGSGRSDLPLILVVGSPRSGTTLLYQVLARCLDVTYFDNLAALFPRAPVTGRFLFGRPGCAAAERFSSYYGNTAGWHAPNDGFHVWNRWLGDHRYHSAQSLSQAQVEHMRRFFALWVERSGVPFLNKNNRNADCVPLLARSLENAMFLEVSREPEYVVQSLLLARETVQGRAEHAWGLDSEPVEAGAGRRAVVDAVCDQVIRVRRKLDQAAKEVGARRYLRARYEDLCTSPGGVVESVLAFAPTVRLRPGVALDALGPFATRDEWRLPPPELDYIRRRLDGAE